MWTDAPPEQSEPAITNRRLVFIVAELYRFKMLGFVSCRGLFEHLGQKPVLL